MHVTSIIKMTHLLCLCKCPLFHVPVLVFAVNLHPGVGWGGGRQILHTCYPIFFAHCVCCDVSDVMLVAVRSGTEFRAGHAARSALRALVCKYKARARSAPHSLLYPSVRTLSGRLPRGGAAARACPGAGSESRADVDTVDMLRVELKSVTGGG